MTVGRITAMLLVRDSARKLRTHRLLQPLPTQLRSLIDDARHLDLDVVAERKLIFDVSEMAFAQVLMVDRTERILCASVCGFPADAPAPSSECITLLRGGEWLLLTTSGHPMPVASHELAQTFPGGSVAMLLEAHQRAVARIEASGVRVDEIQDAAETAATAHHLLGQPARDDRRGTMRTLRANLRRGSHEALGSLTDRADFPARLAEIN